MEAVYVSLRRTLENGKRQVDCLIVADTTPETLPENGAGITGMNADMVFAPMSVLYVVADVKPKTYIADTSGHFVAQG